MPKEKASAADKQSAEVSEVPPKDVSGSNKKKKKKRRANFENYDIYLRSLLKSIDPKMGTTRESTSIMNGVVKEVFKRVMKHCGDLCAQTDKMTVDSREVQSAVQLCLGDRLSAAIEKRAEAALKKYHGDQPVHKPRHYHRGHHEK
jgi:hypothetical protein